MNVINFLSSETYIVLPTKACPKVYLVVTNGKLAKQAFELYNPFSFKAKILKAFARIMFVYLNPLAKTLLPTIKFKCSPFITFLEGKFQKKISSSVYISTVKDKVVLQLQGVDGILGYLKYPVTSDGKERLFNEKKAISILSKINLTPDVVLSDNYNDQPFIVLQYLKGSIGLVGKTDCNYILEKLKKTKKFKLIAHPRVLDFKNKIHLHQLDELDSRLDNIIKKSKHEYLEVYEHGDFAPWNLIKTNTGTIPFDFEYFVESGLENLDEIKYHFQIQTLLNKKNGLELIQILNAKINIKEFHLSLQLFLIKEILNKHELQEDYCFEYSLLKLC